MITSSQSGATPLCAQGSKWFILIISNQQEELPQKLGFSAKLTKQKIKTGAN